LKEIDVRGRLQLIDLKYGFIEYLFLLGSCTFNFKNLKENDKFCKAVSFERNS
jgi:hypothetical protein